MPWPGTVPVGGRLLLLRQLRAGEEDHGCRLPVTATLAVGAAAIWLLIGIPLGVLAGIKRRSTASRLTMLLAIVGVSMPVFWLGQLMLYVFWFQLGWAPPSGLESWADRARRGAVGRVHPSVDHGRGGLRGDLRAHDPNPNVIETMSEDYIRTARAKGMPGADVSSPATACGAHSPPSSPCSAWTSARCSAGCSSPRPSSACPASGLWRST